LKWRNHSLMAGSIALLMDLYPAEIIFCVAAVNFPDQMEMIGKHRIIGHRTWTHEVLLWLVPFLLFLGFPHIWPVIPRVLSIPVTPSLRKFLTIRTAMLFLPGLLHLAGDVLTPRGVKLAGQKVALGLFRTGGPMEYVVTALFVMAAILDKTGWSHLLPGR